jgi:hypothetical protein
MMDEERAKIQQVMQELAAQVLRYEQDTPGLQDAELVRWATNKLSGNPNPVPISTPPPAPPAPSPVPVPPVSVPQPPQQIAPAAPGDEGVLHIQQTPGETIQPSGNSPGGTGNTYIQDNGEHNGNSN